MESIAPACSELKKKYEECFNLWFSEKFLRGEKDDSECRDLFEAYRDCLKRELKDKDLSVILEKED